MYVWVLLWYLFWNGKVFDFVRVRIELKEWKGKVQFTTTCLFIEGRDFICSQKNEGASRLYLIKNNASQLIIIVKHS